MLFRVQIPFCPAACAPASYKLRFPSAFAWASAIESDAVRSAHAATLNDYRIGVLSRAVSQLGQREVLGGRAKFGVFGAGKEVAQLALTHVFRPGDFRAGYYRDQTWMFALGMTTPEAFFAQLYAHDVPGGTGAYMLQQVIEVQDGCHWLDSPPRTLTAQAHRPAYGTDGDYFSKPNVEEVIAVVYALMHESDLRRYPALL